MHHPQADRTKRTTAVELSRFYRSKVVHQFMVAIGKERQGCHQNAYIKDHRASSVISGLTTHHGDGIGMLDDHGFSVW